MAIDYKASKPKYSKWQRFKFIFIRTIFPPVLLWDLIKSIVNKWKGEEIGRSILPAQLRAVNQFDDINDETVSNDPDLDYKKYNVVTHDGAILDTLEITHKVPQDTNPLTQKYIINFVGNCNGYEDIVTLMENDAKEFSANVIGFNFRGVAKSKKNINEGVISKARSKDDLVTDGIAQVQRLLDKQVPAANIIIKAHSLGAGVASLVAQHFHQLGEPVNLFNDRSFSTSSDVAMSLARKDLEKNGSDFFKKLSKTQKSILSAIAKPLVKLVASALNWEIDAASAFKSINPKNKAYFFLRSVEASKSGTPPGIIDDEVISHDASLHKALHSERKKEKNKINAKIKALEANPNMVRKELQTQMNAVKAKDAPLIQEKDLTEAEVSNFAKAKQECLKQNYNQIKNSMKMSITDRTLYPTGGHNVPMNALKNRYDKDAYTFFKDFVNQVDDKIQQNASKFIV